MKFWKEEEDIASSSPIFLNPVFMALSFEVRWCWSTPQHTLRLEFNRMLHMVAEGLWWSLLHRLLSCCPEGSRAIVIPGHLTSHIPRLSSHCLCIPQHRRCPADSSERLLSYDLLYFLNTCILLLNKFNNIPWLMPATTCHIHYSPALWVIGSIQPFLLAVSRMTSPGWKGGQRI